MAYQICTRCVMDNLSDSSIRFNEAGECNYCTSALSSFGKIYYPNEEGQIKLKKLLDRTRHDGRFKNYDCIMGLSGGLDSSYLAFLAHKWGLRVLAVHIDDGYDTDVSKANLERLIKATGYDYETISPDADQFNALTLAYMKAGVPNIAIPQDNILFAFIYKKMRQYGIKYFYTGGNFALECILQRGTPYNAWDVTNIKDIHRKFGTQPIDKLEFISNIRMEYDKRVLGIKTPRVLNYIDYNRDRALLELSEFCGFEYYGRKHLENILTAFIQLYWFPKKFSVDKRKSHLSSMIASGQLTRDAALKLLEEPLYDEDMMKEYIRIICNNMNISSDEFKEIIDSPTHMHSDYKTSDSFLFYRILKRLFKN